MSKNTEPRRLSSEDAKYHFRVIEGLSRIPLLQRNIAELERQIIAAQGASNSWSDHLKEKYDLADGDVVEADGQITVTRAT